MKRPVAPFTHCLFIFHTFIIETDKNKEKETERRKGGGGRQRGRVSKRERETGGESLVDRET